MTRLEQVLAGRHVHAFFEMTDEFQHAAAVSGDSFAPRQIARLFTKIDRVAPHGPPFYFFTHDDRTLATRHTVVAEWFEPVQ